MKIFVRQSLLRCKLEYYMKNNLIKHILFFIINIILFSNYKKFNTELLNVLAAVSFSKAIGGARTVHIRFLF